MCRVPILSGHLKFWGFRLLFWHCWGGRPGIGPKWANMVQNTTKVVIFAIVWGKTWPSSSYSGWSGAYSIGTPYIYIYLFLKFLSLNFEEVQSLTKQTRATFSGKKKAHNHKPGQSGFVPGTNPGFLLILHSGGPVRSWDKPSLSLGHSGDEGRQKEFMC